MNGVAEFECHHQFECTCSNLQTGAICKIKFPAKVVHGSISSMRIKIDSLGKLSKILPAANFGLLKFHSHLVTQIALGIPSMRARILSLKVSFLSGISSPHNSSPSVQAFRSFFGDSDTALTSASCQFLKCPIEQISVPQFRMPKYSRQLQERNHRSRHRSHRV